MKKGFSAKNDGFNSQKWHKSCDDKGKTLVIIKTKDNFIFGGFTEVGFTTDKLKWRKNDRRREEGYIPDLNAFIFSLRNDKGDRNPKKFPLQNYYEKYAIKYQLSKVAVFGSDIELFSNLKYGYSGFGSSYKLPNGIQFNTEEATSYLAGCQNKWEVDELETYFI
ncbi:pep-cterm sorting domain-containing protein [Anaeramoeba ignava]|uniref:Pep-cterm sorting domain-containing protein n=1 Tax=Anaeramoeba ignava TaxID=1746090 RepID=A0A9Q0L5F0_ANAIG|nr:pep-cterm sorting domain-containing protein [Anaeramoeba ignava]